MGEGYIFAGLSLALALSLTACQHRVTPVSDLSVEPSCLVAEKASVTWMRAPQDSRLDRWCAQVGPPVVLGAPAGPANRLTKLLIVSWNVHVGGAHVIELVESLRRSTLATGAEAMGVVLLLQEAYRAGGDIPPPRPGGGIAEAIRPRRPSLDVVALAHYLGMSLAYVPSMRNGAEVAADGPEDRGNAVLSTEPLTDVEAIELPFARQRRVAVAATVTPRSGFAPLRVVAAHLDTFLARGQHQQAEQLADALQSRSAAALLPIVIGIDANASGGAHGTTVATIARAAAVVPCGEQRTTTFFRLDFMLSRGLPLEAARCQTLEGNFGSDHRPLALTLTAPAE